MISTNLEVKYLGDDGLQESQIEQTYILLTWRYLNIHANEIQTKKPRIEQLELKMLSRRSARIFEAKLATECPLAHAQVVIDPRPSIIILHEWREVYPLAVLTFICAANIFRFLVCR